MIRVVLLVAAACAWVQLGVGSEQQQCLWHTVAGLPLTTDTEESDPLVSQGRDTLSVVCSFSWFMIHSVLTATWGGCLLLWGSTGIVCWKRLQEEMLLHPCASLFSGCMVKSPC